MPFLNRDKFLEALNDGNSWIGLCPQLAYLLLSDINEMTDNQIREGWINITSGTGRSTRLLAGNTSKKMLNLKRSLSVDIHSPWYLGSFHSLGCAYSCRPLHYKSSKTWETVALEIIWTYFTRSKSLKQGLNCDQCWSSVTLGWVEQNCPLSGS